ncbi:JAB domain-containing protein [Daejeonella sp.]|uniref:JAB domain-containing protein n=1 Tax=Daejeonella sp. TaxID=2805397 RepID=UPI0030BBA920
MKQEQFPHAVVTEIQLSYHPTVKPSQRPKVSTSVEVYELLKANWDTDRLELQEQFKVMLLNRANRVLGIVEISSGGMTGTVSDPKLIFGVALKAAACSIILSHNHPSCQLKPSEADILLTRKICQAGLFLDIAVLDHIILTAEGYLSFTDEGLM